MENDEMLSPGEVARLFGVDPRTVSRWADDGSLPCIRLPKGHRRFRKSVVDAIFNEINN
jgi:excisionase family DNA binding protein